MKGVSIKNENPYADLTKVPKNLLDPHYHVNGMDYYDDPKYTKPKRLPKQIIDNHANRTDDIEGNINTNTYIIDTNTYIINTNTITIEGASPGWGRIQRREFRNLTSTQDIEGNVNTDI